MSNENVNVTVMEPTAFSPCIRPKCAPNLPPIEDIKVGENLPPIEGERFR